MDNKSMFIKIADALKAQKPAPTLDAESRDDFTTGARQQWDLDVSAVAEALKAAYGGEFMQYRWLGYVHGENGPSGGWRGVIEKSEEVSQ